MTSTMRAIMYSEYGGSDQMSLVTVPKPTPGQREVLIKVHGAGVNPVDWKLREGYIKAWPQTLPIIPGWDVAGVVEAVGSDVSDFKAGDEVYSYTRPAWDMKVDGENTAGESLGQNGTLTEFVSVAQWKVAPKPKSLDMNSAAAIPLAGLTAWQGLFDHGGVTSGKVVLILGASGGVGSFAVQFAKIKGATVIGTCSTRNVEFVRSLGADHVVDYTKADVAAAVTHLYSNGVDMVYDAVGGDNTAAAIPSVKDGGTVVSIANFSVADLCTERGLTGKAFLVQPSASQLREIADLVDGGRVRVGALESYPLEEFKTVFDKSQAGRTRGKLVMSSLEYSAATTSVNVGWQYSGRVISAPQNGEPNPDAHTDEGQTDVVREQAHTVFSMFDQMAMQTGEGKLASEHIQHALRAAGVQPDAKLLPSDGGSMSFDQYYDIVKQSGCPAPQETLVQAFSVFDPNQIGTIPVADMRRVLSSMGEPFTGEELSALLKMADPESSGQVRYRALAQKLYGSAAELKQEKAREMGKRQEQKE